MTRFFIPDTPAGRATDLAYEDLRRHAQGTVGRSARARRIYSLTCRREGVDCETRVGLADPYGGTIVDAIFDVGDGYAVICRGGHAVVTKRQTYEVVEFD